MGFRQAVQLFLLQLAVHIGGVQPATFALAHSQNRLASSSANHRHAVQAEVLQVMHMWLEWLPGSGACRLQALELAAD